MKNATGTNGKGMAMNKKTFTNGVRADLVANGIVVDEEILARAIARATRHMKAKYGNADWESEYNEGKFGNGVFFYKEAQKDGGANEARTFNRDRANFGK